MLNYFRRSFINILAQNKAALPLANGHGRPLSVTAAAIAAARFR
jgi:hypothetical protein